MSRWSYEMFTSYDFDGFNRNLKRALDSIVNQGMTPSVSYSHTITPAGTSYSAVVLGVPTNGGAVAPPTQG